MKDINMWLKRLLEDAVTVGTFRLGNKKGFVRVILVNFKTFKLRNNNSNNSMKLLMAYSFTIFIV